MKKKMSMIMKVFLGTGFILFGLPIIFAILFAMYSLVMRSPEDKARTQQEVAAIQAQRAERDAAQAAKQAEAAAKRDKERLVFRLCDWAHEAVKQQLRAPASAQFPGCVFGADQYQVRGTRDGKTFWVIGYVDSQNGFGAMLRSKYVVKFEHPTPDAPYNITQVEVE